jgi:hypothetical protein
MAREGTGSPVIPSAGNLVPFGAFIPIALLVYSLKQDNQ